MVFSLSAILKSVSDGQLLAVSNTQGPHYESDRQVLWVELKTFISTFDGVWVLAG